MKINKKAQVWVETVVYTLIAFALIGTVLTFIRPKIEELQDKTLIDQSMEILNEINLLISSISGTSGNIRVLDITIKKGSLKFDPVNDLIVFEIESSAAYSEPGQEIKRNENKTIILTEKMDNINRVTITTNYSSRYNITVNSQDETPKLINKAPNPYKISIENKAVQNEKIWINVDIN